MQMSARMTKNQVSGDGNNETFAMTCYEDAEDDKMRMGMVRPS